MASKFLLCSFKTCPWVQRAAIVLREKQVPYEISYIDRNNRPDWFLKISPHAKVPVVAVDVADVVLDALGAQHDRGALHPGAGLEAAQQEFRCHLFLQ